MAQNKKKAEDPEKIIVKFTIHTRDLPEETGNVLIGIQTRVPLYRVAFDLNRFLHTDFYLNESDLKVIRKDKEVAYENFVTSENALGQKIRLVDNQVLVKIEHSNSLFDSREAHYLFPELETMNYILILTPDADIDLKMIQQEYKKAYPIQWIDVDVRKCYTAFPVFPV